MKRNTRKGFTLIELLAVIAILAILVVIAVPAVLELFKEARENTFKTQAQSILKTANQQFMSDSIGGVAVTEYCDDGTANSNKLSLSGGSAGSKYKIEIDSSTGNITSFIIADGTYFVSLPESPATTVNIDDIDADSIESISTANPAPAITCTVTP